VREAMSARRAAATLAALTLVLVIGLVGAAGADEPVHWIRIRPVGMQDKSVFKVFITRRWLDLQWIESAFPPFDEQVVVEREVYERVREIARDPRDASAGTDSDLSQFGSLEIVESVGGVEETLLQSPPEGSCTFLERVLDVGRSEGLAELVRVIGNMRGRFPCAEERSDGGSGLSVPAATLPSTSSAAARPA